MAIFADADIQDIAYQLEIPLDKMPLLQEAITNAETIMSAMDSTTQANYYSQVVTLISQIQQARDSALQSATNDAGLIKVDVVEYSDKKDFKIKFYKDQLRYQLARLIAFDLDNYDPVFFVEDNFGGSSRRYDFHRWTWF